MDDTQEHGREQAADGPEVVPVTPDRSRRPVWAVVLVVAVLVAGVAAGVALTRPGSGSPGGGPAATGGSTGRVDPADQVLRDGVRATGSGEVVALDGQPVRFCAPEAAATEGGGVPIEGGAATGPPADPLAGCHHSVAVTGLDLSALSDRTVVPGGVTGWAQLTGTYHDDGTLTDVTQGPRDVSEPADDTSQPPCPAPAGDWPTGPSGRNIDTAAVDAYRAAHPGSIVMPAMLRPSVTQVVMYVLTTGDPAPVEAALRDAYGAALCVVRSDYTQAQIDAAYAVFDPAQPLWDTADISSIGQGLGTDEQPDVAVGLPLVTDEVVAAVRGLPSGLVQFEPWLAPVA